MSFKNPLAASSQPIRRHSESKIERSGVQKCRASQERISKGPFAELVISSYLDKSKSPPITQSAVGENFPALASSSWTKDCHLRMSQDLGHLTLPCGDLQDTQKSLKGPRYPWASGGLVINQGSPVCVCDGLNNKTVIPSTMAEVVVIPLPTIIFQGFLKALNLF